MKRPLTTTVFGGPKQGKSKLGSTSPTPLLLVDVEDGSRQYHDNLETWVGHGLAPDTDIVRIRISQWSDTKKIAKAVETENRFRTVVVDSISRLQELYILEEFGAGKLDWEDWYQTLRAFKQFAHSIKKFAHADHPSPLEVIYFIAEEHGYKKDPADKYEKPTLKPKLQGQFRNGIQYLSDVVAHTQLKKDRKGTVTQLLTIGMTEGYSTGHRFGEDIPDRVENPTIPGLQDMFYGKAADE